MSRSALSCLWLSSTRLSVMMFSMALSSSGDEDARQTQMLTDRLTSTSSHSVLVALRAPLTVALNTMSSWIISKLCVHMIHEPGERKIIPLKRGVDSGPEVKSFSFFLLQKVDFVYFGVKSPGQEVACLNTD